MQALVQPAIRIEKNGVVHYLYPKQKKKEAKK